MFLAETACAAEPCKYQILIQLTTVALSFVRLLVLGPPFAFAAGLQERNAVTVFCCVVVMRRPSVQLGSG